MNSKLSTLHQCWLKIHRNYLVSISICTSATVYLRLYTGISLLLSNLQLWRNYQCIFFRLNYLVHQSILRNIGHCLSVKSRWLGIGRVPVCLFMQPWRVEILIKQVEKISRALWEKPWISTVHDDWHAPSFAKYEVAFFIKAIMLQRQEITISNNQSFFNKNVSDLTVTFHNEIFSRRHAHMRHSPQIAQPQHVSIIVILQNKEEL